MRQLAYVALLFIVSPIAAHAQSAPAPSEKSRDAGATGIGPDIVVTALRRNRLVRPPEMTGNVLASYKVPIEGMGFDVGFQTDARYQSKAYFSTFNSPLLAQDGYVLLNGRVSVAKWDDSLEIAAQVKNITDKRYITEAADFSSSGWNL